jgi:hypothetical protein
LDFIVIGGLVFFTPEYDVIELVNQAAIIAQKIKTAILLYTGPVLVACCATSTGHCLPP